MLDFTAEGIEDALSLSVFSGLDARLLILTWAGAWIPRASVTIDKVRIVTACAICDAVEAASVCAECDRYACAGHTHNSLCTTCAQSILLAKGAA